jgi:hypothetical protein
MTVLVAGIARDCAEHIFEDVSRLHSALADFGNVHWLVVESDSEDSTVAVLETISGQFENFRYISLGKLSDEYPMRTERIAYCRNVYVRELSENSEYQTVDIVTVADLDGMNDQISSQAIATCFSRTDWDVCTANQQGSYYDVWALRHEVWCPNDCWKQAVFFKRFGLSAKNAKYAGVYAKKLKIPEDEAWIEVDSAFGGMAIYRKHVLEGAQYIGVGSDGEKICEHVPLHAQLRANGYRIFLNPSLINTGETYRGDSARFSPRRIFALARRTIIGYLKRIYIRRN